MRWVPPLAALVLVLAGCGGDGGPRAVETGGVAGAETPGPGLVTSPTVEGGFADEAEVAWLRRVAAWSARFADAGREVARFESSPRFRRALAGDEAALAAYRRVLAPIRGCAGTFRREVGTAPTDRLAESARSFLASCRHYGRGVELMVRGLAAEDEGLARDARSAVEEAGREAAIAAGTLPPGEKQPLPVHGGRTAASRIEPRLSEVAGGLAEKDVEVRCWSEGDWRRLLVEEEAFTGGKVNADALGFASAGGERVNLAPPICAALVDLVYAGERPRGRAAALRLALGLETLAHEAQHVAGIADEAEAECRGIQAMDEAAESLGVARAYADRLQAVYWAGYDRLPRVYRSPECRAGGELDAEAGRDAFP